MATILFTHESCVDHDPGPMHPESPARLRAVHAALADDKYANLERREAPLRRSSKSRAFIRPLMSKRSSKPYRAKAGSCWMAIRMSRPAPARRPAGRSARCARPLTLLSVKRPITPSALYVPQDTMPNNRSPWVFASSTVWRPARSMHANNMGWNAPPSSISTSTMATERRPCSGRMRASSLRQLIRCRFTPVREAQAKRVNTGIS